jgi:Polysaccharide biosynthesis enzyme WcbI
MDDARFFEIDDDADSGYSSAAQTLTRTCKIGFIGNCQAALLHRGFRRVVPAYYKTFYHFFDVPETEYDAARADLESCDLLLMQDIQDLEHYPLRDAIRPGAKIIQFPFLRFAALWPFDDFNGMRDGAARAQDNPAHHTTIYYDGLLGRLRRQIADPQARFATYKSLDVKGVIDPLRVLDFETRRLEALDARFDCGIGSFILNEFRRQQLFFTVNRPNGLMLRMLLDYIFERLDFDLTPPPATDLDELSSIRVPIHPKVAARLGLTWAASADDADWEAHVHGYINRYG